MNECKDMEMHKMTITVDDYIYTVLTEIHLITGMSYNRIFKHFIDRRFALLVDLYIENLSHNANNIESLNYSLRSFLNE